MNQSTQTLQEKQYKEKTADRKKVIITSLSCTILYLSTMFGLTPLLLALGINKTLIFPMQIVMQIAVFGAIVYLCHNAGIQIYNKVKFKWTFIILVIGVVLANILKMIPLTMIFGQTTTANGEGLTSLASFNLPYFVFYTALYAPIVEEIIFRRLIMKELFGKHIIVGYLVSSLFFALLHNTTDLFSFINYFSIGLLFGSVYLITKSMKWTTAAHILNNAISVFFVVVLTLFS